MEPFLGDGFILASNFYPKYKPRRKHVSQAFYREKLEALGTHLKSFLTISINSWNDKIDKSLNGSTTIEISGDFEEILMKNTTKNVFSKDISDTLIDWDSYESGKLTKTQMKVGKAIFAIFNKLLLQTGTRTLNPFQTQFTPLERSMN
jgi:hypothetical protein